MKLEYYVYYHNFNGKSIEKFNIFDHGRFFEDVKKDLKKCKTKEEFAEKLRGHLFYYYCSKCEWEVVIREPYGLYVNPDVGEKVDVYEQVMMNYDIIVDYVWAHKDTKQVPSC